MKVLFEDIFMLIIKLYATTKLSAEHETTTDAKCDASGETSKNLFLKVFTEKFRRLLSNF